jgi:3-hydroxybutyryl-CoA dehydratase
MPDRYYDEHKIGMVWVSPGRTVTEADVVEFAGLSGDYHPLHVDRHYAEQKTRFGQRIAHGLLVLSIATGKVPADPDKVEALYGLDHVRFLKPVYLGDTVHIEMEVVNLRDKGESGIVTYEQRVLNQDNELVLVNQYHLLIRKRPKE